MKYGICGYGNLGKAVERKLLKTSGAEIVGIFSRRDDVHSLNGEKVFKYEQAHLFEGKIDAMLMCGGSQEDLLWQSPEMLQWFNLVDTFDTHAKILQHKTTLETVAKQNSHVAIYSCGWDPGVFSLVRTLSANIFNQAPQTFWGKGVSQGHSEALRNISGVADAIQFTIPDYDVLERVKKDITFIPQDFDKHIRHCFIALDGTRDSQEIIEEINQTENYFKGQKVKVDICTIDEIKQLKENMHHEGIVLGGDETSRMNFQVEMQSNPDFTAQIMLAYSYALPKLNAGAYSVLDVPVGLIGKSNNEKFL